MRKLATAFLLLFFCANAFAGESVYWLRGNDFTTFMEGKPANFMTQGPPNISASATVFEPDEGGTIGTWYTSAFESGAQLNTEIIFWTNSAAGEKISWALYEFERATGTSTFIAGGEAGNSEESRAELGESMHIKPGNRLKLVLKGEGQLELDKATLSVNSTWTSPAGKEFTAKGIGETAVVYVNQCSLANIACSSDSQCDDGNPYTRDSCASPGTCDAACSYTECSPACTTSLDCRDENPLTVDVCSGAGTCDAVCGNITCSPACSSDSQCDDGHAETSDTCLYPGTCFAKCENRGKGLTVEIIRECVKRECTGETCEEKTELFCCGNGLCEQGETCEADCAGNTLKITKPVKGDYANLGETLAITVETATGKTVEAESFFGKKELLDDGRNEDGSAGDGIYGTQITVGEPGTKRVKISSGGETVYLNLVVVPLLETAMRVNKTTLVLTETIWITGSVAKKSEPVKLRLTITGEHEGRTIFSTNAETNESGNFSAAYRSLSVDPKGNWTIKVTGEDEHGNRAERQASVRFIAPEENLPLAITLLKEVKGEYSRGETLEIEASVSENGERVSGAEVTGTMNTVYGFPLEEKENGIYRAAISVPQKFAAGKAEIVLKAEKNGLRGRKTIATAIRKENISIEITGLDKEVYSAGENVEIRARAFSESGIPVEQAEATLKVEGEETPMEKKDGAFSARFEVKREGTINGTVTVKDASGGTSVRAFTLNSKGHAVGYYLKEYPEWVAGFAVAAALLALLARRSYGRRKKASKMAEREEELTKKIRNIQTRYFKLGALSRQKYDELMLKYEQELENVRKEKTGNPGKRKAE